MCQLMETVIKMAGTGSRVQLLVLRDLHVKQFISFVDIFSQTTVFYFEKNFRIT